MRDRVRGNKTVRNALMQLEGLRVTGQRPEPSWFHPFPARMPLSVAEHLISQVTSSRAVILDPMVGSGTTMVASRRLERYSIGFERDPLAFLIARTAVADFEGPRLQAMGERILDHAQRRARAGKTLLAQRLTQLSPDDRQFIDYWFPAESQIQLRALSLAIHEEAKGIERSFAWVVFSSLIIAKSAGASLALDLPRSRPHRRSSGGVIRPFDAWTRRFRTAVARLPFKDSQQGSRASVRRGDARKLPLGDEMVDLVLTSPPYLNAIDYIRSHKFSLVWMGHGLEQLRELRGTMVGTERGLWSVDGLPPRLEERLGSLHDEERERAQRRRYLSDLAKVMGEITRVLRPGGLALLAVGPTIISSRRTDSIDVLSALGEKVGLKVVSGVARRLRAAHRSLPPPGSAETSSPLSLRMRREVIVALRK